MAIDDNTTYGLTGAQLKELPEKIKALSGSEAKELTSADYNYPVSNPDGIAMWLLDTGVYHSGAGVKVYRTTTSTSNSANAFIILDGGDLKACYTVRDFANNNYAGWIYTGINYTTGAVGQSRYVEIPGIVNALNSTNPNYALSAAQGKVLNDKIGGDLSNLTTTDKTSLIAAINELVSSGGGGGGGTTILTTADYNWPEDNPDGVALWKLAGGVYQTSSSENVKTYANTYTTSSSMGQTLAVFHRPGGTNNSFTTVFYGASDKEGSIYYYVANTDTGESVAAGRLDRPTVVQTTGTGYSSVMSQKATSDMIYLSGNKGYIRIGNWYTGSDTTAGIIIGDSAVGYDGGIAIGNNSQAGAASSQGVGATAVGNQANSRGQYTTALGYNTRAYSDYSVAINTVSATDAAPYTGDIAIGAGARCSVAGEMNIGTTNTSYGYNTSNYRLLTGLYDPQSAHDAATKGYVDTINSYSTEEVDTGATWVDGKTIYKKTIDTGTLPNNGTKNVEHGISNLYRVIDFKAWAYRPSANQTFFLPIVRTNASDQVDLIVGSDSISMTTGADRSTFTESYVTLYYTKSA